MVSWLVPDKDKAPVSIRASIPYKRSREETLLSYSLECPTPYSTPASKPVQSIIPPFMPSLQQISICPPLHSSFSSWVNCWVPLFPLHAQATVHHPFLRHYLSTLSSLFMAKVHSITFSFQASMHHQAFFILYPCKKNFHSPIPLQQRFFLGPLLGTFNPFWCPSCNLSSFSLDTPCPTPPRPRPTPTSS